MARRKVESEGDTPKTRKPRKRKIQEPPKCWNNCKSLLSSNPCDYVRICLGNVFVTQLELERMTDISTGELNEEN